MQKVYSFEIRGINNCDINEGIDNLINPVSNRYRVVVTPFDDLRDSFDHIIQNQRNVICVGAIGLIDIVPLFEQVRDGTFEGLDFYFVSYGNFEVAKRNMINFNPILESIDHINSFMIARKFEQFRNSLGAAVEFYNFPELFYHVYNRDKSKMINYIDEAKTKISIKIINLLKEDTDD